jgi:universal stress protein A
VSRPEGARVSGFSRILVAIDFSECSRLALAYARTIADRFDAALHLVHVIEPPSDSGPYALNLYAPPPPAIQRALAQEAEARLQQLVPAGGAPTTPAVVSGRPAEAILDYAARHGIDLIVMGTQGRTGLSHLFLGSVAEHVVRGAPCPVLTVREPGATGPPEA